MNIYVGTTNKAKIAAVASVFEQEPIFPTKVDTGVSEQPFTDEETKRGAIYRAKQALPLDADARTLAFGLEGGVMELNGTLYICNWGALTTHTKDLYVASGARIPLPKEIADQLYQGKELGPVMEAFSKKEDVRHYEGAVGVFTHGRLDRSSMFNHIVLMLKGQWEYARF